MTKNPSPPATDIVILTASHLCRNPRVLKEATALGNAGYAVLVLSISTHEKYEALDQALLRGLPFRREVIDYSARTWAARVSAFFARARTYLARNACRYLHWETDSALGPAHALLQLARAHPARLTIVHTEIPLWAMQYLVRDGRKVAVDFEDWHSEDLMFNDRKSRPLKLLREAERHGQQMAAYTSTTSEAMAAGIGLAYGGNLPLVLPNTFPRQDLPHERNHSSTTLPSFIWFSQTIGFGRGLELFLAAWTRMKCPSHLYLLGEGRPDYLASLLQLVPTARREFVHVLAPVPPEELPGTLSRFDIGLALEPRIPRNRDLTISNKIFQYMNAGLALVVSDTTGQREIMHAAPGSGVLISAHETTLVANQLDALLGDPGRLRACQLAARAAAVGKFTWEHDEPKLLAAVAGCIGPAAPVRSSESRALTARIEFA